MNFSRRSVVASATALLASGAVSGKGFAQEGAFSGLFEGGEEFAAAIEAYIFLYPLVTMEMTRRVLTNVAEATGSRAPMGQLIKMRKYPDASFRDVTAPNADTLYTTSFFDVGKEPMVVSLPDMADRYALFPFLDGWTTVFEVPGKRTTGTAAQTYAITGPGWTGTLPEGVTEYKSPTSMVWLLGRIYCTGTDEDYAAVHALQDQVKLVPLSAYGTDWTAPAGTVDAAIDMKTPVRDQVNALDAVAYFKLACELMKTNPPTAEDAEIVAKLADLGIVPGQDFDETKFNPDFVKKLPEVGYAKIKLHFVDSDGDFTKKNGWQFTTKTGIYGTNYVQRALITAYGLGANRPQDAVYPASTKPGDGLINRAYSGSEKYTLVFPKGGTPPAKGFWSLTMYDANFFFVENPLNRYSISERQGPKAGDDGSITLYIQNESPGADLESNWLPAPKDTFQLMLRMYWPSEEKPSIIDGSWVVPAVTKAG